MIDQAETSRPEDPDADYSLDSLIECSIVSDLAEPYALSAVEPELELLVERHITSCPGCKAHVRMLQDTAVMLAFLPATHQPPVSSKAALFSRVSHAAGDGPVTTLFTGPLDALRTPTIPASPQATVLPPASSPPGGQSSKRSWWLTYAAPLATVPLLLALGLVGGWGLYNYSRLETQQNNAVAQDLTIQRLQNQMAQNQDSLANVVKLASAKQYSMVPEIESDSSGATGLLVADPRDHMAVLQATGLNANLGDYSVIVQMQDGRMVPVQSLHVNPDGSATSVVDLGEQVSELKSVHLRPSTTDTESDVILAMQPDSLIATIGPDLFENADTSP